MFIKVKNTKNSFYYINVNNIVAIYTAEHYKNGKTTVIETVDAVFYSDNSVKEIMEMINNKEV